MSFAPPCSARDAREGASQRFSIWLAGRPDCRNGFETVDGDGAETIPARVARAMRRHAFAASSKSAIATVHAEVLAELMEMTTQQRSDGIFQ
jgi:hypothetical protein